MSEVKIKRRSRVFQIDIGTSVAEAAALRLDDMASAAVTVGTMHTAVGTFQLYGCAEENGTYVQIFDSNGSAANVTLSPSTSVGRAYALPAAAAALPFVKIVSGSTLASAVSAVVTLKS